MMPGHPPRSEKPNRAQRKSYSFRARFFSRWLASHKIAQSKPLLLPKLSLMILWTVYLMPLAFYLVNIGQQYQLGRPRLQSGQSDLFRLFGALSGLVLIGGPRLLAHLHHKFTLLELSSGPGHAWYLDRGFWSFLLSVYAFMSVATAVWLWRRRSGITIVFPADREMVLEATQIAAIQTPFELVEDKAFQCVEIHWSKRDGDNQEAGEKNLAPALESLRGQPGWFWILPVGLGLGLLGFLATLNLGSAFWVFRGE